MPATTFNSGASIPDIQAIGTNNETLGEWRARVGIDPAKQIRLVKLAHMRYQHPDLDEITVFLNDFGMQVAKRTEDKVWFRGSGNDQYVYYAQRGPKKFLGGAFEVESYDDLVKASRLDGASSVMDCPDAPGGGSIVAVPDAEGVLINLIHGQEPAEPMTPPEKLVVNYEDEKPRTRKFQRFQEGPAAVHKLGHYGLCVQRFEEQLDWYTRNFNIVPSDFLYVNQDNGKSPLTVAIFGHIDRGQDFVDHHSLFLSKAGSTHVHHCSFEVHDMDCQQLGHQWLVKKGYRNVWGVGRHILGSQIFDYWWDTTGNMIEHYADGDLVNEDTPIGVLPAGNESLAVWGPEVPKMFLD